MTKGKRIVIIGGVAGGASAAARARRLNEDAEIVLLERGEYVSFANCGLPYHISGTITERDRLLVQTPEGLAVLSGDAIPMNRNYIEAIPTGILVDLFEVINARKRIRGMQPKRLYTGHDPVECLLCE